jgi:hypothetical protein
MPRETPISPRHKQRPGEWRDVLAPEVMSRYAGKHIAIIYKKVVAAGDTFESVRNAAEKLFPNEMPYLAYIPAADDAETESESDGDLEPT